jgi:MoaA/NifB/PqqE/SkfB family radical SAM enzyme
MPKVVDLELELTTYCNAECGLCYRNYTTFKEHYPNNKVRPITITTQNIVFKTGVNDHLIQYQFDFDYGQAYKLII